MHDKGQYYITDMRFWGGINDYGKVGSGVPQSQCHFIIWERRSCLKLNTLFMGYDACNKKNNMQRQDQLL